MTEKLTEKAIGAAFWAIGGSGARVLVQIATQIVLARIIGPEQYGILAIGSLVVGFSAYFFDMGLAYNLVRRNEITDDDVKFVFTWQFLCGAVVAALIYFFSSYISVWFKEPRSEQVLVALSSICLINALCATSTNLLKRNLDYKAIQSNLFISYFIGYVIVGVSLAALGYGVWAVVTAWILSSVINLILCYIKTKHILGICVAYVNQSAFMNLGGAVVATNIINWMAMNLEKLIVARYFPGAGIGLYTTTFNLVNIPTTTIYSNLQSVIFSAAAKRQDNVASLRTAYEKVIGLVIGLSFPAFLTISLIADNVIYVIYGDEWIEAGSILAAFALCMPLLLIWGVSTPVLWNRAREWTEATIQLPLVLIWGVAAYLISDHGMNALAWSLVLFLTVRVVVLLYMVSKVLEAGSSLFTKPIVPSVGVSFAIAAFVKSAEIGMVKIAVGPYLTLFICACIGVLLQVIAVRYVKVTLTQHARDLLIVIAMRFPVLVRDKMVFLFQGPK